MRIAFRLMNKKSKRLLELLMNSKDIVLVCIVDGDDQKWGNDYEEGHIPIVSPYKALTLYKENEIDYIFISPFCGIKIAKEVLNEMVGMGIPETAFLMPSIPDVSEKSELSEENLLEYNVGNNRTLYRVQYHIADHCNLNCVSCSHYSSLVTGEQFIQVDEIKSDLLALSRLVKHIDRIDILGGEPFLNKNWKEYIRVTLEIFKYSEITIITNGTLIYSLTEKDWDFLRENGICIRISLYPPFWKKADDMVSLLKQKNIKYIANFRVISDFAAVFKNATSVDGRENRANCMAECNQIWHAKMSPCNQSMYIKYFNEYFDTELPDDISVKNISEVGSFEELVGLLKQPMGICKYCNIQGPLQGLQKWEQMKAGGRVNNSMEKWYAK